MPNYVNVTLQVDGKGAKEFASAVKDAEGNLSFGSIRPVPEPLMNDEWQNNKAVAAKNVKEHGFTGWYDWRVTHWGTKWEAIDPADIFIKDERYQVFFMTAWSPPEAWVRFASAEFPELTFTFEFHEEGGMYDSERVTYHAGVVVHRETIPNENLLDEDEEA